MARRSRRQDEEVELNEVDAFDSNKEKVLLEQAGNYLDARETDEESDEEVLGIHSESENEEAEGEDEGEEDDEEERDDEDDEEKGWGTKQNYYGGDDASDDEDSKQMTEEALKQQKKHLQDLALDDYVDEDMMQDWQKSAEKFDESSTDKSQFIINKESSIENLDDKERLQLLNQSFPEFIPLLKELNLLEPTLKSYQKVSNTILEVKKIALSAYLGSITSYFAIFTDNLKSGETFTSMKDNAVMETILSCREVWRQANELPDIEMDTTEDINDDKTDDINEGYEMVQNSDLSEPESESSEESDDQFVDAREGSSDEQEFNIDLNTSRKIKGVSKKNVGDFTESANPEDVDMEDKHRRKRTLRFYTSKIDQAAAKSNERYSGDLDLPYRERLFERQQRLVEEARKRGLEEKDQLGADLDEDDFNSDEERVAEEINNGEDNAYYESLKQDKQDKKDLRRAAHDEAVTAAKEGKLEELQEKSGPDGKRAVNFQILKNKGLTPHRKKENRNSRVKKRKQYEKAQKKLKSVRQVYDGTSKGPYDGEKTGIKKGISRSVKLV